MHMWLMLPKTFQHASPLGTWDDSCASLDLLLAGASTCNAAEFIC